MPFARLKAIPALTCLVAFAACARAHHHPSADSTVDRDAAGSDGGLDAASRESAPRLGFTAIATLASIPDATDAAAPEVMGTAMFAQRPAGVTLLISITGCDPLATYDVVIQQGGDCEPATLQGEPWDDPRGAGISNVMCTGTSGVGHVYYTRADGNAKPWSIDGSAASNLVGHALVIYAAGMPGRPVACGTITRDAPPSGLEAGALDASGSDAHVPSVEVRAELAGFCLSQIVVRSNDQSCPDVGKFEACVSGRCGPAACYGPCAEYSACLEGSKTTCDPACNSVLTLACSECTNRLTMCAVGFCTDQLSCAAPPVPGGPCSMLEACCGMQGDGAPSCLQTVHLIEKISGDPSCLGVMHDWDTTAHLAVPCHFN